MANIFEGLRRFLTTWTVDVGHGVRALFRAPAHAAISLLCLSLGIVASAGAFSVVNALFYRELPGTNGHDTLRRVQVVSESRDGVQLSISTNDVRSLTLGGAMLPGLASEGTLGVTAIIDGAAVTTAAAFVSGNYFSVLGSRPSLGRLIEERDDRAGADPVVVVSNLFWRRRLAARLDSIGQTISVGGRSFTIVGVAPERFSGFDVSELGDSAGTRLQFWFPLASAKGWPGAPRAEEAWHSLAMRVAAGTLDQQAAAELRSALPRPAGSPRAGAVRVTLSPMTAAPSDLPRSVRVMITWFLCIPLMVLVIGCANVANLQLARATDRAREMAVRSALGATRAQIARLLTAEAVVLATMSGAVGLLGTMAVLKVAGSFVPLPLAVDWRVLTFTVLLAAGVVLLAGLAPAWLAARRATIGGWRRAVEPGDLAHTRLRSGLVVLQIALSVVLLVATALFARSLQTRYSGVQEVTRELAVGAIHLQQAGYEASETQRFLRELTSHLSENSGVKGIAAQSMSGFQYQVSNSGADAGRTTAGGFVTTSWFETLDVRTRTGRLFDLADGSNVAVINERLALELAPTGAPVGRLLRLVDADSRVSSDVEIVGVIPDVRRPPDTRDFRAIYMPMPASPPPSLTIVVRTADPQHVLVEFRRFTAGYDARLAWADLSTGEDLFLRSVMPVRYLAISAGILGTFGLFLASAGLFAVMAYVVSLRRREIGVRLALGARPTEITALVLRQAVRVVASGTGAGLCLAIPIMFLVRFLFEGVSPLDPVALGSTLVLLALAGVLAAALPAVHAGMVDPMETLRGE